MPRRLLDILGASVLVLLSLPIFVPAVLAALVLHGRPVFYGHRRVGRSRKVFVCWKLRTMVVGAEERLRTEESLGRLHRENGFKLPTLEDPRVTAFGRWLRKSYVDELPQLFNVLRGDLALVGPRPVVDEELAEFGERAEQLLAVRPGIFGAWACLGPRRPAYPERAEIELRYVEERTLATDLGILARSLGTVLQGEPEAPARRETSEPAAQAGGTLRRTLSNANALLFAYLLPRGFSFLSVIVAARALGTTDFGAYGTAAAFAVILSIVATLGMTPMLIREIAREPERAPRLIRAAHLVKSCANVIMLGLLVLLARFFGYDADIVWAAALLGVGYAVGSYAENLSAYFQARERMYVWTQASAIFGFVSGLGGIAIVLTTGDLVLFCVSPALGWIAALVWLLARAPQDVRWGAHVKAEDVQALLRSLVPFAVGFALMVVYYKADVLLLAAWRSAEEVGIYSASYKVVDIFQALVVVASGAVYPRLSRLARRSGSREEAVGGRSTGFLLLASLPVAGGAFFLADPLIALLYGPSYGPAAGVLAILALVLPFLAVTIHGGYVLAAAGRMGTVASLYVGALVANLSLNALLIPSLGGRGAAFAMLSSEAMLSVGFVWALHRLTGGAPARATLWAVPLAFLGGWFLTTIPWLGPHGDAVVFVGYLLALYPMLGAIGAREMEVVASALTSNRRVEVGS